MSRFLPLLADRVLGRPLMLAPSKAEIVLDVLAGRIALGEPSTADADRPDVEASQFVGTHRTETGGSLARRLHGVAIVTVSGSLVNRGAWINSNSGLVSYEGIGAQIDAAVADKDVHSIIIDMNSFGGEATGMSALAAKVRNAASSKNVIAVVNDVAASAGYGIISGAHEIVVSPTSIVGSIGVVMMHVDRSGELEQKGLKPTFIHAGAHKVDGHGFAPLPANVRADLQRDVNAFYDQFISTVAEGRGKRLTADAARATEARTYIGQAAIDAGLADRSGTFDEILSELTRPAARGSRAQPKGKTRMGMENEDTVTRAEHDKAVSAARAEGEKAGATAAAARIGAILGSDEAKGREAQASHFAFKTSMTAEDARAALAVAPAADVATDPVAAAKQAYVEANAGRAGSGSPAPSQSSGKTQADINAGWDSVVGKK